MASASPCHHNMFSILSWVQVLAGKLGRSLLFECVVLMTIQPNCFDDRQTGHDCRRVHPTI